MLPAGAVAPSQTLLDVTDLVEFWQRLESVSGVQRVIESTAPLLLAADPHLLAVVLDRARGVFIALTRAEVATSISFQRAVAGNQSLQSPAPRVASTVARSWETRRRS